MDQETNNIELRSQEIQEILGKIPHWIIRIGISIFFIILLILLVVSYFFKYPTTVSSSIRITSQNPPIHLKAEANGKIDRLFVSDGQHVDKSQLIAVLESNADYQNIIQLETFLDSIQEQISSPHASFVRKLEHGLLLGDIQPYYSKFVESCNEYQSFIALNYYPKEVGLLEKQIQLTKEEINLTERQAVALEGELNVATSQCSKDSSLFKQNLIEISEFKNSTAVYSGKMNAFKDLKSLLLSSKIQLKKLEREYLDLTALGFSERLKLESKVKSAYGHLVCRIDEWKVKNLFVSPIDGRVSFTSSQSLYRNINIGDVAFTIVPNGFNQIMGIVELPISDAGKVKVGQIVNIKLDDYSYMEFGILKGKIKSISSIASDEHYVVFVDIPNDLTTNYGKSLNFSQNLKGSAEIIIENISVLQRLIQPLKAVLKF